MNDNYKKMIDIMREKLLKAYAKTNDAINFLENNVDVVSMAVEWWISDILENYSDELTEEKINIFRQHLALHISKEVYNNGFCSLVCKDRPTHGLFYVASISKIPIECFSQYISINIVKDCDEVEIYHELNDEYYYINRDEYFSVKMPKNYS